MKFLIILIAILCSTGAFAQLPKKVKKLEGTWSYKEGSGYEKWSMNGDIMNGESFRINKLGDTIIAERFVMKVVNKRLVLHMDAYRMQGDSVHIESRDLIGEKRKMLFTNLNGVKLETLEYKTAFLSKRKLYIILTSPTTDKARKLTLYRQEAN